MVDLCTKIHLVRHGEVHNPDNILYGRLSGFRLSRNGLEQAKAVGSFFQRVPVRAIYTSPLLRARKTAEAITVHHQWIAPKKTGLLNEVCTPYEGLPGGMIDARKGDIYTYEGNGNSFEQPADVFKRLFLFCKRARKKHTGQDIVAVTHGDVIVFALIWAFGQTLSPGNKNRLREFGFSDNYPATASITRFTFKTQSEDEIPRIDYHVPYR